MSPLLDHVTRRRLLGTGLVLGLGTAAALSRSAAWACPPGAAPGCVLHQGLSFEEALERALADLSRDNASIGFDLVSLTHGPGGHGAAPYQVQALVRLTWRPGTRQRPVHGSGLDAQAALEAVIAHTRDVFACAFPPVEGTLV